MNDYVLYCACFFPQSHLFPCKAEGRVTLSEIDDVLRSKMAVFGAYVSRRLQPAEMKSHSK
jgi:hypothetical protein